MVKNRKEVYDEFIGHLNRLNWRMSIEETLGNYVLDNLSVSVIEKAMLYMKGGVIDIKILDDEEVYKEVVKCIGLMEVSKTDEELLRLLEKKREYRWGPRSEVDFSEVMRSILKVPKQKD